MTRVVSSLWGAPEAKASAAWMTCWMMSLAGRPSQAGHCPPILLRSTAAGRVIERLDQAGGTVVGLVSDATYEHAHVDLGLGDLLAIYTDGFSEAMSPDLEEWAEKRLFDAVKSCD